MYSRSLFHFLLRVIVLTAILSTIYLYLYPIFHGCAFPSPNGSLASAFRNTLLQHLPRNDAVTFATVANDGIAPFRLLVLADPQLEGDSSLPKPEDNFLPRVESHWNRVRNAAPQDRFMTFVEFGSKVLLEEIPKALSALRKRLDLFGNDYYLAHIYRSLYWWTQPTHTTVLGDLIGSQWVNDDEFEWRGWRYWNRVFLGGHRVEDDITTPANDDREKVYKMDDPSWKTRIINIAGNHDIGYAGDISRTRMERFERVFGKANWDVRFEYPLAINITSESSVPSLHMVVLNSLILDTPALDEDIQKETYEFINSVLSHNLRPVDDSTSFTLLLTHVPLYKKAGVCVDGPFFDFWGGDTGGGVYRAHGLKEQNHLSDHASRPGTLESLFGMRGDLNAPAQGKGRNGLILTGHDHEGCDVYHYVPSNSTWHTGDGTDSGHQPTEWDTTEWKHTDFTSAHTGVREVTLRSMMGEFGGNAGLLSAWFDFEQGEWKYEIQMCQLGVQHIWWAIHILNVIAVFLVCVSFVRSILWGSPDFGSMNTKVNQPIKIKQK